MHRGRRVSAVLVGALALLGFVPAVAHAAPAPDQTYVATDDAYVSEAAPTVAKGATDPLNLSLNDDLGNRLRPVVQFDVTGLGVGDTVTGAEIRIVDKGNADGVKPVQVNGALPFDENTVTWNNMGAWQTGTLGSDSTHAFGQDSVWVIPVSHVSGNGTYSFVLSSPPNSFAIGMNFQPKENTVGKAPPRLVLHVDHTDPPVRNNSVFGANVHQIGAESFSDALAREDSASSYGPLTLRLYFTGLPSTDCTNVRNVAANDRPSTISFKDVPADIISGADDATINAWLSCFTRPTRVTYYHEMEDNFPAGAAATQWVTAWQHFYDLVAAHPNRANLITEIIYGDFTWAPGSGRDPLTWWPGDTKVDEVGADLYNFLENDGNASNNQTMAQHQVARPSYAFAVAHGKPYGIGEMGYDDPATRPAFLRDAGAWLKDPSRDVRLVQYFDGGNDTTPQPGNHRLLDQASIDAWRDVIHN